MAVNEEKRKSSDIARGTAAGLRTNNPVVYPGTTIIESDTQRRKTNKDKSLDANWNDLPYDDNVLVFDSIADLRAETVPYRRDQEFVVRGSQGGKFYYDEADTTTAEDGGLVFVDAAGRRIKRDWQFKINVEWLGAIADDPGDGTGTDNSAAFQKAIDVVDALGGGVLFIPSPQQGKFFRIQKVYVLSGVRIEGAGALWQNNISGDNKYRGTKVVIGSGGLGFVFGHPTDKTKATEASMLDVYVKGTSSAVSGIRLGSDVNYSPANNCSFTNVRCEYFSSSTASHPVMDKSTEDKGSLVTSFTAAQPATGAAGVFISTATFVNFYNCRFNFNFDGLSESSPRNSYMVWMFGGQIRGNSNLGIKLKQTRFLRFFGTDIEANTSGTLNCEIPVIADAGGNGISDIIFNACHFENPGTQFMKLVNPNIADDRYFRNIVIRDCSYLGAGTETGFIHADGVDGLNVYLTNGLISGLFYTRNVGRNPIQFAGNTSNLTFDLDEHRTIINNTNVGIASGDSVNNSGGGLNFQISNAQTGTNTTTKQPLSYSETPPNLLAKQKRKKFVIEADGEFEANDNKKNLWFEFDNIEIIRNLKWTHPNGEKWKSRVEITKESDTLHTIRGEMTIGDKAEKITELKRTVTAAYWGGSKFFRVYGLPTVAVTGEMKCFSQNSQLINY
jgi:hypothetical protein